MGIGGLGFLEGNTGFVRVDFACGKNRIQGFYNRGKQALKAFQIPQEAQATSGIAELSLDRTVSLPFKNRLVAGASYRRNTMQSNLYLPGRVHHDLWALFVEDEWRPAATVSFVASARLDRHPLTGWVFSPRGSLVFSPTPRQALRLSSGTSFRNPTLTENYVNFKQSYGQFPVDIEVVGSQDIRPERMVLVEAAHSGQFGPLRTTAVGFFYRLSNVISVLVDRAVLVPGSQHSILLRTLYVNYEADAYRGPIRMWGGEVGAKLSLNRRVTAFFNTSFQRFSGEPDFSAADNGGPEYKINGGFRFQSGGFTLNLWTHWVGETLWNSSSLRTFSYETIKLDSYALLNMRIGYAFRGLLKGLEVSIDAFNLTDHAHFEILPAISDIDVGQSGEVIRRRLTGTLSYGF